MREKHVASASVVNGYKWKELAIALKADYHIFSEAVFEHKKEFLREIIREGYIRRGWNVEERRLKQNISKMVGRMKEYMFAEEEERKDAASKKKKPLSVLMKRLREEVIGEDDKKYKRLYEAYLRMCDEEVDEE